MTAGLRVDLWESDGWRWRLWSGSRIVGGSTESYVKQSAAIHNIQTVTGGQFEKTSMPDSPTPFGLLRRREAETRSGPGSEYVHTVEIPVRLVES